MKFLGYICSCYKFKNVRFDKADTDSDGKLSLNEFRDYFVKTYGKPPSIEQWMKFHFADINNSGYVTKAEIDIFKKKMDMFD